MSHGALLRAASALSASAGGDVSLLHGWLPPTVQTVAAVVLIAVVARRSRRWFVLWVPVAVGAGVVAVLIAQRWVHAQGLTGDSFPPALWIWAVLLVAALALSVAGWRGSRWWRRTLSVLAVPLCLLALGQAVDQWVGYYPSVEEAWGALTNGPLPEQVDLAALPGMRDSPVPAGAVVAVDIPDRGSGFAHRSEYVYLPPAWFAGPTPPALPVIMMIGGEFNSASDWIRSGDAIATVRAYADANDGNAPILLFVDSGGRIDNDTECVDGPRGNAADHLVTEARPFVVTEFGADADPARWGVVGWSMGGTCAMDLTVMHPDAFSSFVDIGGDSGPNAGDRRQTIDRLYGGDAARWAEFDPLTVMTKHGPYTGVSGIFVAGTESAQEASDAERLCTAATAVSISCRVRTATGGHTWQFAARAFADTLPWLMAQLTPS